MSALASLAAAAYPLSMVTQMPGWRLARYVEGCAILRTLDATFRYAAVAPTTRGEKDEFQGFAICYVPPACNDDEASVVEVPKEELQRTMEQLVALEYIKRDQEEARFAELARRWYTGLKITHVTITVPVVKTLGFIPIAAFDSTLSEQIPIISSNVSAAAASSRPLGSESTTTTATATTTTTTLAKQTKSTAEKRTSDDALEASSESTSNKRRSTQAPPRLKDFELQKSDIGTTKLTKM